MKNRTTAFLVSFIVLLCVYSCSRSDYQAPKRESVSSRLTLRKNDTFEVLMERNMANIKYMMYGYINFDNSKIIKATDNIVKISHAMEKKIPDQYLDFEEEWQGYFQNAQEITSRISEASKEDNYDDATKFLNHLVTNCMTCHDSYKAGISTKPVEDSLLTPTKADALTTLMDRNLENLEYLMHGYMNLEESKVVKAAGNLIKIGADMEKKIPVHYKSREAEWKVYCKNQREVSIKIEEKFKQAKYEEATELLHSLITSCMTCHKLYKSGISSKLMSIDH